ncbi:hypothetical protein TNCV_1541081 [Trichonephila clavipes]|nr:hypothetical protein TNCV_1541081 [Trichonephila clavipes]
MTLQSNQRVIGDESRNFEPQSSDEDSTRAVIPPLQANTPCQQENFRWTNLTCISPLCTVGLQWQQDSNWETSDLEL